MDELGNDISDWIFLAMALAVYFDATHHKIGKIKGKRGWLNMTAGGWAVWTSMTYIGLIPAMLYVVKRQKLIDTAKEHPKELSLAHRLLVVGFLFILPMFLVDVLMLLLTAMPVHAYLGQGL